jgi:hypothetical protein
MLTTAHALLALTPLFGTPPTDSVARFPTLPFVWEQQRTIERQPTVRLWFRGDNLFRHGDYPEVYFRTDEDAYVMIVRIDTDGRLEILSPSHANGHQFARAGRTYDVPGYSRGAFRVDDDPGMGYVFAVASWEPFNLDRIALGRSGAYRFAGQRIHGDPFVAVQDLADELLDDRYGYYALDHVAYYVNRRYEYPRYLCYDCHGYRSYSHWDPYAHRCVNFRIVIYNDPYYYPYRYSRGSRVIYVRDTRRPRYEFKGATTVASAREPYIDYRFRGDDVDRRRPGSPAHDPNLPRRTNASSPGATRPGEDVPAGGSVGGRRVLGSDTPSSPGPDGRLPRREGQEPNNEARTPRRGTEPQREPERRTTEPRREPERREAEPRRESEPRREPERREAEPRRESEPRREPERREAEPRRESEPRPGVERRSEPRRETETRREPERRAEPRQQPERRAEPRREPERKPEARPSTTTRKAPERREAEGRAPERSTSRPATTRRKPDA